MVREEELVQKAKEVRESLVEMAADEIDATHIEVGQIKAKDDTRKLLTVRVGGANRYVPYQGHDTSEFTVGDYWAIIFDDYGTIRLGWWVANNAGAGTIPNRPHNVLDGDAHPDTVAQVVTRGSMIIGDSTPLWNELVIGLAGRYLRSDGTDLAYAQIPASEVVNTPAGGIAATDVQTALNELDTEKAVKATYDAHDHSAGDPTQVDHPDLTNIGEPFDDHPNNPCGRVYRSTDQSIPNNVYTAISFSHERFDTDNIWVIGSPTKLTCKTAGKYQISGHIRFETNNTGRRGIKIRLNDTVSIAIGEQNAVQDIQTYMGTTTLYDLAVDDYVELHVLQNSGGNLDIQSGGNYSPEFMMVRVG